MYRLEWSLSVDSISIGLSGGFGEENCSSTKESRGGAYVSNEKTMMMMMRIDPQKIARNASIQRHPALRPRKSLEIGPSAGPKKGAVAKMAIPSPRLLVSSTSEIFTDQLSYA